MTPAEGKRIQSYINALLARGWFPLDAMPGIPMRILRNG